MRKGGYSRLGVFGTMNHYDNSGYKIGESRPGLFGSVNTYDSSGDRISRSDKSLFGGFNHYGDWERINEDPFDNQAGVAEGVMFLDDNFGIAGLAGASQSHSTLYITKDGGRSFGEIKLPMSTVTELPESAKEYGFTVEDYDYLNMPQIGATTLIIMVTTDKGDNDGIVFESEDGGDTWKYRGVTQN